MSYRASPDNGVHQGRATSATYLKQLFGPSWRIGNDPRRVVEFMQSPGEWWIVGFKNYATSKGPDDIGPFDSLTAALIAVKMLDGS